MTFGVFKYITVLWDFIYIIYRNIKIFTCQSLLKCLSVSLVDQKLNITCIILQLLLQAVPCNEVLFLPVR